MVRALDTDDLLSSPMSHLGTQGFYPKFKAISEGAIDWMIDSTTISGSVFDLCCDSDLLSFH